MQLGTDCGGRPGGRGACLPGQLVRLVPAAPPLGRLTIKLGLGTRVCSRVASKDTLGLALGTDSSPPLGVAFSPTRPGGHVGWGPSDGGNQPGLLLPTAKSMWPIGSSLKRTCPTKNCSACEAMALVPVTCLVGRKSLWVTLPPLGLGQGPRLQLHAVSGSQHMWSGWRGGGWGVWLPVNSSAAPKSQAGVRAS